MTFKKNKNCVLKFTNLRKDFLEFLIKDFFEDNREDFEENLNIIEVENDFKRFLKFLNLDEDLNHNFSIGSEFLRELDFINYYFYNNNIDDIKNIFKLLKDLKVFNKKEVQEFLKKYLSNYLENFDEENEEEEEEEEFINEDILNNLEIFLDYYNQPLMTEFLDVFPSNKEKINALKIVLKYFLIDYAELKYDFFSKSKAKKKFQKNISIFIREYLDKNFVNFEKHHNSEKTYEFYDYYGHVDKKNEDFKYFDLFITIFNEKDLTNIDNEFYIKILINLLVYLKNYDKDKFSDFLKEIQINN